MRTRISYNIETEQHRILKIVAASKDLSASAMLRQILSEWITNDAHDIIRRIRSEQIEEDDNAKDS